jgi:hypothetical protein
MLCVQGLLGAGTGMGAEANKYQGHWAQKQQREAAKSTVINILVAMIICWRGHIRTF